MVGSAFYIAQEEVKMIKPPLGLKPRNLFLEERLSDIKRAINEYFESNQEVPTVWIKEYNDI